MFLKETGGEFWLPGVGNSARGSGSGGAGAGTRSTTKIPDLWQEPKIAQSRVDLR